MLVKEALTVQKRKNVLVTADTPILNLPVYSDSVPAFVVIGGLMLQRLTDRGDRQEAGKRILIYLNRILCLIINALLIDQVPANSSSIIFEHRCTLR